MNNAAKAIQFIESLKIPEGPKAGKSIKLAKFQKDFIRGTLKKQTAEAVAGKLRALFGDDVLADIWRTL